MRDRRSIVIIVFSFIYEFERCDVISEKWLEALRTRHGASKSVHSPIAAKLYLPKHRRLLSVISTNPQTGCQDMSTLLLMSPIPHPHEPTHLVGPEF